MPKPTLRPDGRWMIQLPRNGKSRRCVYGRTESEAIAKYNAAIGAGSVKVRPGSISEFMVTRFLPWLASRIQPDSLSRYDVSWRNHIGPAFGHMLFGELSAGVIQEGLLKEGLSAASIDVGRGLFQQIVKLAIAEGHARPEHLTMIQIAHRPKVRKKQREDITDKARKILALSKGDWMEGPIWAAATLGLRKGEICGLKPTDILDDQIIIRSQRNHTSGDRQQLKHREPGEVKRIGLPSELIEKLRSFIRPGSLYVFTNPSGRPLAYQHFVREMDRLWLGRPMRTGEHRPPGAPNAHDLRSAAIVNLIEAGVNDHTIMDLVGHSAAEVIRIYRDESVARTREAMSKVSGMSSGPASTTTTPDNQCQDS